ncbi:energy transducer TonB [Litorimonas sp. WD9-15]|uniref:energy transducer TonB n=1 Tax=Litorimonas sp. WD9-15 TaxID=3418716 RepID=UPI003D03F0EB
MLYDIDRDGRTQNVEATYCTDEVYRQESIRTLSSWVYDKKRQDGTPVAAYNITASIAYRIEDMMGVPISGPHEFMTPLSNGEYYMERICSPLIG